MRRRPAKPSLSCFLARKSDIGIVFFLFLCVLLERKGWEPTVVIGNVGSILGYSEFLGGEIGGVVRCVGRDMLPFVATASSLHLG